MANKGNKNLIEFCNDFCDCLCRRDITTRLYLRQKDTYRKFEDHVTLVRHNLKTSLQYVMGNMDKYTILVKSKLPKSAIDEINDQWRMTRSSMLGHKENTKTLTSPTETGEKQITDIDVFKRVSKWATLYAAHAKQSKNATFDSKGLPKDKVYVRCNSNDFDNAVAAILENAIKYSYSNWAKEATITLKGDIQNGQAEIIFENYGVGIPELKKIKERTVRGNVIDTIRNRPGEGLGLYIASCVFVDQLGGEIDPTSKIPENITDSPKEHHKHVVQITVTLPIFTKD